MYLIFANIIYHVHVHIMSCQMSFFIIIYLILFADNYITSVSKLLIITSYIVYFRTNEAEYCVHYLSKVTEDQKDLGRFFFTVSDAKGKTQLNFSLVLVLDCA